jgi:glycosyltransferase involved in cell wall biosynthesis
VKRVLSISTLYPNAARPRFGPFVARSLEALAARGDWEVTLVNPIGVPPIALGRYRELAAAAVDGRESGVAVHRLRFTLVPLVGARLNAWAIARAVLPLARRLHAESPFDLVDAQFFFPDGPAAARIARALGLPLSIKARGADIQFWGQKPWARRAMRRASDQAAGLLAVCQALAEDMAAIGMPRHKTAVHYTGLDRDRFRPLGSVGLRKRLGEALGISLPDNAPLLATVGALIPRKGQKFVIGAMRVTPGAHLLLVGRGEDEAMLRGLVRNFDMAERVHFLGNVDHNLLPLILSAADVMVLPSASEGLANAWIEALACGTPLVITDAGGAREVIAGRDAGVIVARTEEAIAEGIADLLADKPPAHKVAAAAARFSWEANAAALAEHYERLVTG